jgi:predicted membrane channel-forming protein YqfA (hemolysin III family)
MSHNRPGESSKEDDVEASVHAACAWAQRRADFCAAAILADAERRSWATVVDRAHAPPLTHERFVFTNYRPYLPSLGLCLRSMFAWHNATLSIWSSLLLVALNLYLGLDCARAVRAAGGSVVLARGFALHGGLRAACWLASWAYHTFAPHSPALASALLCADYLGCILTVFAVGGNVMLQLGAAPDGAVAAALIVVAAAASAGLSVGGTVHRGLVAGSAVMGGSVLAAALASGAAPLLPLLLVAIAFETAGAAVFFFCIPERWFPHSDLVDCLANSHALWHWANVGFDVYTMRFAWAAFVHSAAVCGDP